MIVRIVSLLQRQSNTNTTALRHSALRFYEYIRAEARASEPNQPHGTKSARNTWTKGWIDDWGNRVHRDGFMGCWYGKKRYCGGMWQELREGFGESGPGHGPREGLEELGQNRATSDTILHHFHDNGLRHRQRRIWRIRARAWPSVARFLRHFHDNGLRHRHSIHSQATATFDSLAVTFIRFYSMEQR